MLLRARRPFIIGGKSVKTGEVVNLEEMNLPAGRAQKLVDARYGEYVVVDSYSCESCDRTFSSAHALAIHAGRTHRNDTEE